ncbi:MAG: hypothetical protein ACYDBJ_22575 [Aggregatilineales bacterium]
MSLSYGDLVLPLDEEKTGNTNTSSSFMNRIGLAVSPRCGKVYGPYKYRRLWHHGKLTDHYEGKATPDEYRDWLAHKAQPPSPISPEPED